MVKSVKCRTNNAKWKRVSGKGEDEEEKTVIALEMTEFPERVH